MNNNNMLPPLEFGDKKINHYVQNITSNVHHFYLYGMIDDDISMYSELLNVLKTANENDTVVIYINSEGGVLRMALQIANAMLSTQARVVTSLDGEACSAATIIFLAGHEYIVNPNCTFMIHFYSGGAWGKGHELEARVNAMGAHTSKLMKAFYDKILSEQELADVVSGRDIYMDSEELLTRLEAAAEASLPEEVLEGPVGEESVPKKSTKPKKKKVAKKKG